LDHTCAAVINNYSERDSIIYIKDGVYYKLFCWGGNDFGQLDIPPALGDSNIRVVKGGSLFSCMIEDRGSVLCWGLNNFGQLRVPDVKHILTQAIH